MKQTLYTLLVALCLFASASCSQTTQEEGADITVTSDDAATSATDTAATSDEVPESLQHH